MALPDIIGQTAFEAHSDSLKLAKEQINWGIREKQENQLNPNGGTGGKGSPCPPGDAGQGSELNSSQPTPSVYWNEDAQMHWLYPANNGTAILDGRLTTVLIDSGARMNCVTLEFVKVRDLAVGSIQDLNNHSGRIPINGAGGKCTKPLGYMMIRVQIPQVPSYDEDQVALIVEDLYIFSRRCPIIPGTPTIFQAIQAMKESEMHNLELAWQYAKAGYEYHTFYDESG